MKKIVLLASLFFVVGCSDPMDFVIPEYQSDRDVDKAYISSMKNLSDHDRALVNGYIGIKILYRERLDGITIGKAIETMERSGYGQ